jgi:magnesium-transporting ATPase (P-type)
MIDHPNYHSDEEETGHIHTGTPGRVIWRWTLIAAVVSLVANLVLYFLGVANDWIPEDRPGSTDNFSLVSVILASVIPVLLFGGLMVYLANHAPRASRLFEIILLVVLIIAVMVPFTLQGLEDSFQYVLVAMHIITAGSILGLTLLPEN